MIEPLCSTFKCGYNNILGVQKLRTGMLSLSLMPIFCAEHATQSDRIIVT